MNKIFTLLSAAVITSSMVTKAETTSFEVYNDDNGVYEQDIQSDLSVKDNIYTIDNFLNSGSPVQFTIETELNSAGTYSIYLTGNIDVLSTVAYPLDDDGNYLMLHIFSEDDTETVVYKPMVFESGYSYAKPTEVDGTPMYDCMMTVTGDLEDGSYAPYYNVYFYAPDPTAAAIGSAIADDKNANAPVEYYNLQGLRVNNPENGLFIRRQGSNVKKVLIK